jgi:hypothetical protein
VPSTNLGSSDFIDSAINLWARRCLLNSFETNVQNAKAQNLTAKNEPLVIGQILKLVAYQSTCTKIKNILQSYRQHIPTSLLRISKNKGTRFEFFIGNVLVMECNVQLDNTMHAKSCKSGQDMQCTSILYFKELLKPSIKHYYCTLIKQEACLFFNMDVQVHGTMAGKIYLVGRHTITIEFENHLLIIVGLDGIEKRFMLCNNVEFRAELWEFFLTANLNK